LYPTIIGDSDVQAGQKAWLCYARLDDKVKIEWQSLALEMTFENDE